jgi:hypothetical protein
MFVIANEVLETELNSITINKEVNETLLPLFRCDFITVWSRELLEKLTVSELIMKLPDLI